MENVFYCNFVDDLSISMQKREFFFPSADGITKIHAIEWIPEGVRHFKGIIQIAHGLGEHIGMYEPTAEFFTDRGFVVRGNSYIGHGYSVAEGHPRMYFGEEGSRRYAVDDIYTCRMLTRKEYGELPYVMLGFSTGSYLIREYLIRYQETLDAAILMGCGMYNRFELTLAKLFARTQGIVHGWDVPSKELNWFINGFNNLGIIPRVSRFDWLNSNPAEWEKMAHDPLSATNPTSGLFREILECIDYTGQVKNVMEMDTSIPIFFLSGDEDPTAKSGKIIRRIRDIFKKAGVKDIRIAFYHGRHRILFEKCSDRVLKDIYDWTCSKLQTEDVDSMEMLSPVLLSAQKSLLLLAKGGISEANELSGYIIEETEENSQSRNYNKVSKLIELVSGGGENCTVIDIGCGFAPRAIWCSKTDAEYIGADLPAVIREATGLFETATSMKPNLQVADVTSFDSLRRLTPMKKTDIILLTENLDECLLMIEKESAQKNMLMLMNELGAYWINSTSDGVEVKMSEKIEKVEIGETEFYMSHEVKDDNVTVTVMGSLNAITAPKLIDYCEGLKKDLCGKELKIDISQVTEESAAGMKALAMLTLVTEGFCSLRN